MSHPLRVRGLKSINHAIPYISRLTSHPLRVRGLKLWTLMAVDGYLVVAPSTGAWIEISIFDIYYVVYVVAPSTGAWIEIA